MNEQSNAWNERLSNLECWVCGSQSPGRDDLAETLRWVHAHEHSRIEREAARIVELELRKADREAERRNRRSR